MMAFAYKLLKKRSLRSVVAGLVMVTGGLSARAQTMSYEQTDVVKLSGVTNTGGVTALPQADKITNRTYVDGLGRPLQTVGVQASPLLKDMVQPVIYDKLGQTTTSYLPYTATTNNGSYQTSPLTGQAYFYSHAAKVANDDSLYARQVFETSPLQRLLRAGTVGSGFEPGPGQHYKTLNYRTNTTADYVILWSAIGVNVGFYPAGKLQVTDATDEDGTRTQVFTNTDDQPVLKRQLTPTGGYLNTYYVYNTAGGIRNVIPPKAVALMEASGNWSLTQTAISNLIFSYEYDDRARQIQKNLPGGVSVYVVYDPINRPVLLQDANLRAHNQWNYIKYDAKSHAISQGIYTDNTYTTLATMQAYVNTLNYSTTYFESRSTTSATGYYTNNVFPATGISALGYSYYDDYDLDNNGTAEFTYQSQGLSGEATPTDKLRGIPTMVRSRTVGQGLADIWLIKVMFYDKNYRTIQVQGNNQLNSAVADIQTSVSNFTGVTTKVKVTQVAASTTTTVLTSFSYDHMYRTTAIDQAYNGGSTLRVAAYEYNELGQLVKKNLKQLSGTAIPYQRTLNSSNSVAPGATSHQTAQNRITITTGFTAAATSTFSAKIATNYLQAVDYRYNIRGQMVNINNSKLVDDGGITNEDVNDLFGMDILYNQVDANLGNTASFSGQISAVKWMTRDASNLKTNERSYKYTYDILNRITASTYAERTSTSTGTFNINTDGFNESGITYDENGNIKTLQRTSSGINAASHIQVDDLNYTYDANQPNRLKKVTDGIGANYTGYGFRNLTGSTADYAYDDAGNLVTDPYKGLTLTYNELNRTDQITITTATNRYIRYTYNSSGQMIRKQAYDNATLQKTTDYINGFVYENSSLTYFAIPEGRMLNVSGTLTPEFVITDQQGNSRVSFRDNGSGKAIITQENSYYAFGLVLANSPVGTPAIPNKNLYNGGSEWQNDFSNLPDYYNTFFRNYDAALGRFVSLDPDAESAADMTGYQYAANNPVLFNDPLGDRWLQSDDVSAIFGADPGGARHNAQVSGLVDDIVGGAWAQSEWYFQESLKQAALGGNSYVLKNYFGSTSYKWNPFGGGDITEDEWVAQGGDRSKIDRNKGASFSAGAWKKVGESPGNGGSNWATAALSLIAADVVTPDPTDAAWPKWAVEAVVGVVALEYINLKNPYYYVTYTKTNAQGKVYVGRSSGYGDPQIAVYNRDRNHKMPGYGPATLSSYAVATIPGGYQMRFADPSYWFIRGSEQLQIEYYRQLGISSNAINGIGPNNKRIGTYLNEVIKYLR